jgi:hypothetical protein
MPDPNARRDKALENIARSVDEISRLLVKIERNTRPKVQITNSSYLERSDATTEQRTEGATSGPQGYEGPYGAGSAQPYS